MLVVGWKKSDKPWLKTLARTGVGKSVVANE
jgi:hypothetical protein